MKRKAKAKRASKKVVRKVAKKVQAIPVGYNAVTLYLAIQGAAQVIEFYKKVFGAKELMRMPGPAGKLGHVEIKVGDSRVMLADERGRWLLGPHPEARSEYRLRTRERSFRIDRYFVDTNGVKWVVDYKTSEHEGGGLEGFLDQQRERYASQLDGYAQALGGARRGLYFPLQRGWREWSD